MNPLTVSLAAAAVILATGLVVCLWCIGAGWRAARPRLVEPDRGDDGDLMALWDSTRDGER